jgi:DNA-binding response OmpR family regulator
MTIEIVFTLLGSLALLIFGMKTMSNALQKMAGPRLRHVLARMLLSNRGTVLARQQLLDSIWEGVIVTDRTIDVQITRLRKKLGTYASHIVSRQGFGYVFE